MLHLLDEADAAGDGGFALEGEDAVPVLVVEAEAEGGGCCSELGTPPVEEEVLLEEGLGVEWGEEGQEALMGVGIG